MKNVPAKSFMALLFVFSTACMQTKEGSVDQFKNKSASSDQNGDAKPANDNSNGESGSELVVPKVFLSKWTRCLPFGGSSVAKAGGQDFYFVDENTTILVEKIHPDAACASDFTDAQLLTLFKASNPNQSATAPLTKAFNAAIKQGTITGGIYTREGPDGSLDQTDDKGVTVYRSFKSTDTALNLSLICAAADLGKIASCKTEIGSTAETRSKDFSAADVFTKVSGTSFATETVTPPATAQGIKAPSTYTLCLADAASQYAKGMFIELQFTDDKATKLTFKPKADALCAADIADAQMLAYYKEVNPSDTAATVAPAFFKSSVVTGTVSTGAYKQLSTSNGTIDLTIPGAATTYQSYKLDGAKLSLSNNCEKADIGKIASCLAETGATEATRSTDYTGALVLTKK